MTGFNVALRMRRDPLVAKYAQHLESLEFLRRSPVGDVTFFQSGAAWLSLSNHNYEET
jgi:hypothetical protein